MLLVMLLLVAPGSVQAQVDAIFANRNARNRVCLNDGTGAFTCRHVSNDFNATLGVAVGDVDGQNGLDAIFANRLQPNRVCLNDGTGAFTCSDVSDDSGNTYAVAVGDMDGQNGPDIIFANSGSSPDCPQSICRDRVCLNDGTGAFACGDVSDDILSSRGVAVADVDGRDGPDAIFANVRDRNRVCLNDGTGAFTCGDVSPDSRSTLGVAVADVDGQNGPDAVFATGFPDAVGPERNRVCLNDGTGVFTCGDVSPDLDLASGVALADVDGQNGPDAIFSENGAPVAPRNRVCLNDGTGAFTCSVISEDRNHSSAVAVADVDGQNGPDAIFANLGQRNRVCLNDGTGAFTCGDVSPNDFVSFGVALAPLRTMVFADGFESGDISAWSSSVP